MLTDYLAGVKIPRQEKYLTLEEVVHKYNGNVLLRYEKGNNSIQVLAVENGVWRFKANLKHNDWKSDELRALEQDNK